MPIDPRISLGVQPIQIENPMARYGQMQNILAAQAQQQAAGTQQQAAQMQLTQAQRQFDQDEKYVTQMADAIGKEGGPTDMMKAARLMSANRNPQVSQVGIQMLQTLQRLDEAKKAGIFGAPQTAMPSVGPAPGALGSGTFDVNAPMAAPMPKSAQRLSAVAGTNLAPTSATNLLAPAPAAPAAPVNKLVDNTKALQAEFMKLAQYSDLPGVKDRMELIKEQLKEANKNFVVGGNLVTGAGKSIFTAAEKPPTQTELVRNYEYAKTPAGGNYKGSFSEFKAISTPKTTNVFSTEKKYSEQFANKMADTDIAKMGVAEKAPQQAANANQIIDLVSQGDIFVGPVANIKLNIARALNVAGANNEEKIANTESLISASGQGTLNAIKDAGLGTGQGFTDKDLTFLQGIAGGTIDLTPQALTRLATLQHQAATRSAENWNKRVKQLPKSATEGTGLSLEPIEVPPLSSSAKPTAARPAGVGPNWTYESDASGNKAWVSPDRKSFKEAK